MKNEFHFFVKKIFFSKLWRRLGCGTENLDDLICRDFRITAISGFLTLGLSACIFHPTGSYCTYGIIRVRHDAKFRYRGSQIGSEFEIPKVFYKENSKILFLRWDNGIS